MNYLMTLKIFDDLNAKTSKLEDYVSNEGNQHLLKPQPPGSVVPDQQGVEGIGCEGCMEWGVYSVSFLVCLVDGRVVLDGVKWTYILRSCHLEVLSQVEFVLVDCGRGGIVGFPSGKWMSILVILAWRSSICWSVGCWFKCGICFWL